MGTKGQSDKKAQGGLYGWGVVAYFFLIIK